MDILKEFLKENHDKFFKDNLLIGFTDSFPEDKSKVIDQKTYKNENSEFEVRLTKLTFGKNNEYSVLGIVTDCLELPPKGPLNGFGQHGYLKESELMKRGVIDMLTKHDLMICTDVCSWPFVKVIVQKPEEAHLRCFKEKLNK